MTQAPTNHVKHPKHRYKNKTNSFCVVGHSTARPLVQHRSAWIAGTFHGLGCAKRDPASPGNMMKASSHTLTSSSCFMAVKLTFERARPATPNRSKKKKRAKAQRGDEESQASLILPTDVAFKSFILTALKEVFGEVGSLDYPVDVLSWDPENREGQLRVPARCVVPIRAALSLVGSCGNTPCAINVTEASPFLAGLACQRYL